MKTLHQALLVEGCLSFWCFVFLLRCLIYKVHAAVAAGLLVYHTINRLSRTFFKFFQVFSNFYSFLSLSTLVFAGFLTPLNRRSINIPNRKSFVNTFFHFFKLFLFCFLHHNICRFSSRHNHKMSFFYHFFCFLTTEISSKNAGITSPSRIPVTGNTPVQYSHTRSSCGSSSHPAVIAITAMTGTLHRPHCSDFNSVTYSFPAQRSTPAKIRSDNSHMAAISASVRWKAPFTPNPCTIIK